MATETDGALAGANFDSFSASRGIVWACESRAYNYRQGAVLTPLGIVALYDQDHGQLALTRLDFVVDGRCHSATFERRFSDRYLITLARRFAEHVTREADHA